MMCQWSTNARPNTIATLCMPDPPRRHLCGGCRKALHVTLLTTYCQWSMQWSCVSYQLLFRPTSRGIRGEIMRIGIGHRMHTFCCHVELCLNSD